MPRGLTILICVCAMYGSFLCKLFDVDARFQKSGKSV